MIIAAWQRVESNHMDINCDVVVIGGGINGCAIAADLALRKFKVVLIEKKDFASGTSWASTKLIHGGLRYLALGHVSLVRKALKERTRLHANAPNLVKPIALNLVNQDNPFRYLLNRLGLWLYDHLDWRNPFPPSKTFKIQQLYHDLLKSNFKKGVRFYDAFTDDVRLTIMNAKQAANHGAILLNYCDLNTASFEQNQWQITCNQAETKHVLSSKYVINATGPWINEVNETLGINSPYPVSLVKGSHIVMKNRLPNEDGLIFPTTDNRIIFVLPYFKEFMLIGTTEEKATLPEHSLGISSEEKTYLLRECNRYFSLPLKESDVIYAYSGIRPLIGTSDKRNPSAISREYQIHSDTDKQVIYIYGGKLTTHRQLAEECANQLSAIENKQVQYPTQNLLLPGNTVSTNTLFAELKKEYPLLKANILERLIATYGSSTKEMLETYLTTNEKPALITENIYQFEIDYLKDKEWLKTLDDFLWRRTKLGLTLTENEKQILEKHF